MRFNVSLDMIVNVSFHMTLNVDLDMILNVGIYDSEWAAETPNVQAKFSNATFSFCRISWFSGLSRYPCFSQCPKVLLVMNFRESSVPLKNFNVLFFLDNMFFPNFQVPPNSSDVPLLPDIMICWNFWVLPIFSNVPFFLNFPFSPNFTNGPPWLYFWFFPSGSDDHVCGLSSSGSRGMEWSYTSRFSNCTSQCALQKLHLTK